MGNQSQRRGKVSPLEKKLNQINDTINTIRNEVNNTNTLVVRHENVLSNHAQQIINLGQRQNTVLAFLTLTLQAVNKVFALTTEEVPDGLELVKELEELKNFKEKLTEYQEHLLPLEDALIIYNQMKEAKEKAEKEKAINKKE